MRWVLPVDVSEFPAGWVEFRPLPRPAWLDPMEWHRCFSNAQTVVLDLFTAEPRVGVFYAEGLAWATGAAWHHAWVCSDDGEALDPTWDEPGVRYVGQPFTTPDVARNDHFGGALLTITVERGRVRAVPR